MRRRRWHWLLCLGGFGCGLFRDFDELQREHEPATAETLCSRRCDDGDPCTVDRCGDGGCINEAIRCPSDDGCPSACEAGRCVARAAIVPDGLSESSTGDIYYSQVIEHEARFFHAAYGRFDESDDIVLRSYPSEGTRTQGRELRLAAMAEAKGYTPISPGSMVVSASDVLYTYFAARPVESPPDTAGSVLRVATELNLELRGSPVISVADVSNYRSRSRRLGPVAGLTRAGVPFVAWEGCTLQGEVCMSQEPALVGDGGVYLQHGEEPVEAPTHLFHPYEFRAMAALHGASVPGVAWLSQQQGAAHLNTWFVADAGPSVDAGLGDATDAAVGPDVEFPTTSCPVPDGAGHALTAVRERSDLWTLAWTTRSDDDFTSASSTLCAGPNCLQSLDAGSSCQSVTDARVFPRTRHLALGAVESPAAPDAAQYHVAAHAFATDEGAFLALRMERNGERAAPGAAAGETVAAVTLVSTATSQLPEWPTLALSREGKLLVSWIQPAGERQELHVQRHKICFGEASSL